MIYFPSERRSQAGFLAIVNFIAGRLNKLPQKKYCVAWQSHHLEVEPFTQIIARRGNLFSCCPQSNSIPI